MPCISNRWPGLSVDAVNPQLADKPVAMVPTDLIPQGSQIFTNLPVTPLRAFQVEPINQLNELQLLLLYRYWLTINRRTIQLHNLALPSYCTIM